MKSESEMTVKEWVEFHTNKHLCACGCGEYIVIKPHHHEPKVGIPKFISGHNNKTKEARKRNSKITSQRYIDDPDLARRQSDSLKQFYLDNPEAKEKLSRKGSDNGMYGVHRYGKDAANWRGGKIEKRCKWCGNFFETYPSVDSDFCSYECMGKMRSILFSGENHPRGFLGKHHTEETKQRQSEAISGENHYNWKGGVSAERDLFISSAEYKNWRKSVFERDDYTCCECGRRGGNLNAHHILPYRDWKDEQYSLNIDNGITLCESCHRKTFGKEYESFSKYFDLANGIRNIDLK